MKRRAFYLLGFLIVATAVPLSGAERDSASSENSADRLEEMLLPMLQGEFALQEGDSVTAAAAYVDAAERSTDVGLAERATRIALLAEQPGLVERALRRWQQLQPDALGARQIELVLAIRDHRTSAAVHQLGVLLEGDKTAQSLAIQALADAGENAVPVMQQLLQEDFVPTSVDILVAIGALASQSKADALVDSTLRLAAQRFPGDAKAILWRVEVLQLKGDQAAALETLSGLPTQNLSLTQRLRVAALFDGLGETARAAAVLAEGEQSNATYAGRAAYLARLEQKTQLRALYAELTAPINTGKKPDDDRRFLLAQIAEYLEENDDALIWYRAIVSPVRGEPARLRIAVLLDRQGRLDDAISELREIQSSASDHGEWLRDAYLLEAEILLRNQRAEHALETYRRGLTVFEDDPALLYGRALCHERLDQIDAALRDLKALLDADPDNPDTLNSYGYTLADRTDRLDEARRYIEQALTLSPESAAIMDSMGWVLHRQGLHDQALPYLQRAWAAQKDAEVAAHLGDVLWALGRAEEAREVWLQGETLDPANRALKRSLQKLQP
ncbi:MAG: Tetratricopeptide repeat protein [Alphaproteobacteria bacterium ADurb.BinA280]|jgi:tetratricopeptide (TPR) repeat protein|nr:tetratricopeptide repeat protein [Xanthomonadales bacterium]MCC6505833.1 tetratricopeptide repeat protein [Aquimonas sp.]OPZ13332.1 MAG: Tetratricopeptide repeat protein [Alphaproteobacteria bacterium ADurb.BinA280]